MSELLGSNSDMQYKWHITPVVQCDYYITFVLQDHLRMHDQEKEHECGVCGEKVMGKKSYQIHMMEHEGKVPFLCDICYDSYPTKSALAR